LYNYPRKKIIKKKIQDAWGWGTGMTQRDGTGRDVIAGFRLGNVVHKCRKKGGKEWKFH